MLFGGADHDTLTDGDDQCFGEACNDRFIWNPGDDTDVNEGGPDTDLDGNDNITTSPGVTDLIGVTVNP